jgi:hypothetical protein
MLLAAGEQSKLTYQKPAPKQELPWKNKDPTDRVALANGRASDRWSISAHFSS